MGNFFERAWDKVKKVLTAELVVFAVAFIFGGPQAAFSTTALFAATAAASATIALDTGEGRQLIRRIGNEFFDDILGLPPNLAYTASSIFTHVAATVAFNFAYTQMLAPSGSPSGTNAAGKERKALNVDLANDDPPVEVYYRGLDLSGNGKPQGPRLHPFMKDWKGNFYELERVNGKINILEGKITDMSPATRYYWKTNPRPDKIFDVYGTKFNLAVDTFRDMYKNTNYNLLSRNSRNFVNYVIDNSRYR